MKTGLSDDEMARIRAALEAVPAVEKAVLFGSRAMGLARSNSDVDILLYGDALRTRDVLRVASLLDATTLPYQFDLIRHDAGNASLLEHVREYGKVIFQRQETVARSKSSRKNLGMVSERLFSSIPSEWEYKTLGEACAKGGGDIQTGPFGSQLHASDYVQIGIPSIMPQNIGDNRFDENGIVRIAPKDAQRLSRYLVRTGDIVYSRRGDVERRALVRTHENGWLCGTGCLRVRLGEKGADPQFVSYYLGHPSVREWIVRHAHGATMPNLNTSILGECPFLEPPIEEQRAIAHILGTLDDKIELNRRMNETLEAMARTLFKAWFVDFEPVRAKQSGRWRRGQSLPGLPAHFYELFPDRLVESELGEIPEGWTYVPASQLIDFNPHEPLRKGVEAPYIEMSSLPTTGSWPEQQVLRAFGSGMRFRNGDVLLARITPCLENGKTALIQCLPDNIVGWGSTEYIAMRAKAPVPPEFVYLLARDGAFREQAIRSMTGTSGRQRVQADSIAAFRLASPQNTEVWNAFSRFVGSIFKSIKSNAEIIAPLTTLRDTLLPRLISGELSFFDKIHTLGVEI